jgi:hypothetical protein
MSRAPRTFVFLMGTACAALSTASHAESVLPSFPSSSYPYYQTLREYTFDAGGNPDPQGWTTHDLTVQDGTFWRVEDFAGLFGWGPLDGFRSMWCGVRPGVLTDPLIQHAPGYGDHWTQILESSVFNVAPNGPLYFTCGVQHHLGPGDRVDVEYRGAGPWTNIATLTGWQDPILHEWSLPTGPGASSTIQFRFVMSSDLSGSDEAGPDTNGAIIIDAIGVFNGVTGAPVFIEYFENAPVGGTTSSYFQALPPTPGFGNYAGLVSGSTVAQSGTSNTSHVWSFFNGSTTFCGGLQPVVPYTMSFGSTRLTDYLCNEVRSPWIDLTVDKNTQPVDPNMNAVSLEFDAYADLHGAQNLVRYTYRYRFRIGGIAQEWHTSDVYRYSDTPQWVHEDIFSLGAIPIPANATHVQVGLVALDYAYATGAAPTCHSQAPLFDDVIVHRMYTPMIVSNANATGPGSLTQAIADANVSPDFNAILFNIPGPGPHTIEAPSLLITHPVWIDGFSQAGSAPNLYAYDHSTAQLKIALDGAAEGAEANGLHFMPGSYGVVRGLAIGRYDGAAVRSESTSLIITGCYLGTDASGTVAVPNGIGIHAVVNGIDIGGPANTERMMICASNGDGIRLDTGSGPILNCHLGYDALGFEMANNGYDIHVLGGTSSQIGQPHISPCGTPYTDRVRVGISGIGVEPAASGVMISQARMSNPYIDLGSDGTTANDPLDADTGANGLQNYPVLVSADGTTIRGSMDGLAGQLHHIEFFAVDGPGETQYLGYQSVTTDGAGHAPVSFSCGPIPPGSVIRATATAGLNTSELSPSITSTNTPPGAPLVTLYDPLNILRASVEFDNVTGGGNTFLTPASPSAPSGWNVGGTPQYWDISTSATYDGLLRVTLHYDPNHVPAPENMLRLLHLENGTWTDITDVVDTGNNSITGLTYSLSPFVLAVPNGATGVGDGPAPADFALHPNVPNPFNPATTIHYDIPAGSADVTIAIYDIRGALVRTLVHERRPTGRYTVRWNGDDDRGARVASGLYFYRMRAGSFVETRKMVLLK